MAVGLDHLSGGEAVAVQADLAAPGALAVRRNARIHAVRLA